MFLSSKGNKSIPIRPKIDAKISLFVPSFAVYRSKFTGFRDLFIPLQFIKPVSAGTHYEEL